MQIDHITDFGEATLDSLVAPDKERVVDTTEDILDQIASQFSSASEEDDEENLDDLLPPIIIMTQASEAFSQLINFEQQRAASNALQTAVRLLCRVATSPRTINNSHLLMVIL